jgi:hypothetical protein
MYKEICNAHAYVGLGPGANPSIASYNAHAVEIYNAPSTYLAYIVRFENIYIFHALKIRSSLLQL